MAAASFELPNGFVNHGAMACEALAALGWADDIDSSGPARFDGSAAGSGTPARDRSRGRQLGRTCVSQSRRPSIGRYSSVLMPATASRD
jgi:hypothetical protein